MSFASSAGTSLVLFGDQKGPATWAFDPDRDLPPHEVTVSGTLSLAPGPRAMGKAPLDGAVLRAQGSSTATDAQGRFTLRVRDRGSAWVQLDRWAWLKAHPSLDQTRHHMNLEGHGWAERIDLEAGPPNVTLSPTMEIVWGPLD